MCVYLYECLSLLVCIHIEQFNIIDIHIWSLHFYVILLDTVFVSLLIKSICNRWHHTILATISHICYSSLDLMVSNSLPKWLTSMYCKLCGASISQLCNKLLDSFSEIIPIVNIPMVTYLFLDYCFFSPKHLCENLKSNQTYSNL